MHSPCKVLFYVLDRISLGSKCIQKSDPSQITWRRWEQFCFGMLDFAKRMGWE